MKKIAFGIITVYMAITSCKKLYTPQLTSVSTNFLAVDGPIISGDSTFIRLSRTTKLSDTTQNKTELKATVAIESDENALYPLTEKGKGLYVLGITNFDVKQKYRLDIKTSDGKIYQSDFVPAKITPPIDSVYFKAEDNDNILFYLDTHDATNSTRYYRWDYKETWRYTSLFRYAYYYKNGVVNPLTSSDVDISTCYRTASSNQIFVGSSAKLNNDIITNQQLGGLTSSEKIVHGYVLQVKQYALTKEGFEYYQNLKTNTEQLGSIFDAQPSILKGNIHCINNPAETVIGFISVSTVTNKQVNLTYSQIPINYINYYGTTPWVDNHYYNSYTGFNPQPIDCPVKSLTDSPMQTFQSRADAILSTGDYILFDEDPILLTPYHTYYYVSKQCIDCRLLGGTTTKPSYFPF